MGIGGSLGSGAVVAVVAGAAVLGAVVVGAGVLGAAVVGAGVDCCSGVWSRDKQISRAPKAGPVFKPALVLYGTKQEKDVQRSTLHICTAT